MAHRESTAEKYYRLFDKRKSSVKASQALHVMIREGTQKEEKQESKQAVEKSPENIDFQDKRILTARSPWNEDSLTAVQALFQEEIATQDNRGPVAQLVEQRVAMQEVWPFLQQCGRLGVIF